MQNKSNLIIIQRSTYRPDSPVPGFVLAPLYYQGKLIFFFLRSEGEIFPNSLGCIPEVNLVVLNFGFPSVRE